MSMNKTRKWVTLGASGLAIGAVAFFVGRAWAGGIPATGALTYSGLLEDQAGAPLTGDHPIFINLWSTATPGTTPLCQTQSTPYTLAAGRFSVPLPDACTDAIKSNADVWTEVLVDGVSLGTTKLGAVPYAVEAGHAVAADSAASATSAGHSTTADSATNATNATHASSADAATNATNATTVPWSGVTGVPVSIAGNDGSIVIGGGNRTLFGSNSGGNLHIDSDATKSDGQIYLNWYNGKGVTIGNGAQGGIATFSTNGNLSIGGTFSQGSSEALKKDITYLDAAGMQKALDYVNKTPVATYRYKTMSEDTKVIYGVIAEKTPSALLAQGDKAVNISTTIGVLLASIKAQQGRINQLEVRLKKVEHRPSK